ncbi:hypothetical protein PHYSODRAFT_343126, partial [Phytophthora sojae]
MLSKCRVFIELWEATQVELHGQYSAQRVLALAEYEQGTHLARSVLVMLVTPLPCLVITILIDILPLSDPSEGIENNNAFMVRQYYNYLLVTFIAIQQIRIGVPSLPYNNGHVLRDTIVVATLTLGIYYAVTLSVGFPLPFTILVMMSPWSVLISLCLAIQRARVIRDTPGARAMLSSMFKLWMYEILMVFIYPPYFYVFTTLSDKAQAVAHLGDEIPELVIFNADVFSSLFVSYCMQSSPSFRTTMALMLADILQIGLSLRDILIARTGLAELEHLVDKKQINMCRSSDVNESTVVSASTALTRVSAWMKKEQLQSEIALDAHFSPVFPDHDFFLASDDVSALYLFATYHLPNREYYAVFDGMDETLLLQTLKNVILYCLLQLVSLMVLMLLLRRILGHSPARQISFVLEKQLDQESTRDRSTSGRRLKPRMPSFRVDADGDVEMTILPSVYELISAPELASRDQESLVKWLRERRRYREAIEERCRISQEPVASVLRSVRASVKPKLLDYLARYVFRQDRDTIVAEVMNGHIPDIFDFFKTHLRMDLKEQDVEARVVKYFVDFDQLLEEHGFASMLAA